MGMYNQNGRGQHDEGRRDFRQQDQRDDQGQGQSGYAAGRQADDPSMQFRHRNQAQSRWGEDTHERGFGNTDDRFTGRGGEDYGSDRGRGGYGGNQMDAGRIGRMGEDMGGRRDFERGGERMGEMGGHGFHNLQARPFDDRGPYDDSGRGARSWNPQDPYREMGRDTGRETGRGGSGSGSRMSSPSGQHRGKGPQGYQRSDERIRENVCEALTDDEHLDATHIEVTVKNGEVTLAGTVEDRAAKRMAEDIAERCSGVKDVTNQIKVGGDQKNPSNQIGNGSVEKPKARA